MYRLVLIVLHPMFSRENQRVFGGPHVFEKVFLGFSFHVKTG